MCPKLGKKELVYWKLVVCRELIELMLKKQKMSISEGANFVVTKKSGEDAFLSYVNKV